MESVGISLDPRRRLQHRGGDQLPGGDVIGQESHSLCWWFLLFNYFLHFITFHCVTFHYITQHYFLHDIGQESRSLCCCFLPFHRFFWPSTAITNFASNNLYAEVVQNFSAWVVTTQIAPTCGNGETNDRLMTPVKLVNPVKLQNFCYKS